MDHHWLTGRTVPRAQHSALFTKGYTNSSKVSCGCTNFTEWAVIETTNVANKTFILEYRCCERAFCVSSTGFGQDATNLNVSARSKRQVGRWIAPWLQPDCLPIHPSSTEFLEWDDTAGMHSVLTLRKCRMCRQPCATPWTMGSKHSTKSSCREAVRESLDSPWHGSHMWLLREE